jgi:hypothetical protein
MYKVERCTSALSASFQKYLTKTIIILFIEEHLATQQTNLNSLLA